MLKKKSTRCGRLLHRLEKEPKANTTSCVPPRTLRHAPHGRPPPTHPTPASLMQERQCSQAMGATAAAIRGHWARGGVSEIRQRSVDSTDEHDGLKHHLSGPWSGWRGVRAVVAWCWGGNLRDCQVQVSTRELSSPNPAGCNLATQRIHAWRARLGS